VYVPGEQKAADYQGSSGPQSASPYTQSSAPAAGGGSMFPAIIAGATAIAGMAAQAYASDGTETVQGYELPVQFEIPFINEVERGFEEIVKDREQLDKITTALTERLDLVSKTIQGTMPDAATIKKIRENTNSLVLAFGKDAQSLVDNGFLTEEDQKDLEEYKNIQGAGYRDPTLEREHNESRAALEQELARSGVTGTRRLNALRELEQAQTEETFGRREQLRDSRGTALMNLVGTRADLRSQGFGRSLTSLGILQGELTSAQQGADALAGVATAKYSAETNRLRGNAGFRAEAQNMYETVGKFNFSDQTKDLLSQGLVGPGSVNSQIDGRTSSGDKVFSASNRGFTQTDLGGSIGSPLSSDGRFEQNAVAGRAVDRFSRASDDDLKKWLRESTSMGGTGYGAAFGFVSASDRTLIDRVFAAEIQKRRLT
jgi:hypothetical protein